MYLQYGVQVITRQFNEDSTTTDGPFVGIILALLTLVTSHLLMILSRTTLFHRLVRWSSLHPISVSLLDAQLHCFKIRRFIADYGMPITIVATSGMAYWGRFNSANPTTLPTGGAFQPAGDREWLVRFWQLDAKHVGIAFP